MQAGIPNIPPKVSAFRGLLVLVWHLKLVFIVVSKHPINAFFQGTGGVLNPNISYSPTDPDCWWTFGQCTTPKTSGVKADIASVPEVSLVIFILYFLRGRARVEASTERYFLYQPVLFFSLA